MDKNDVIGTVNGLLELCRDGQAGYRLAGEGVRDGELRRLFGILSQQRAQFVTELEAEVHRLGGRPAKKSAGKLARNWAGLKGAAANGEEGAIVAACERAEGGAVRAYGAALQSKLPLDVEYVVKRQYMDIKDAYDRLRILQRAA